MYIVQFLKGMWQNQFFGLPGGAVLMLALAGCDRAPSQPVFGAYFPSWMLCAFMGIAGVVALRQVFVVTGVDAALPSPILVYLMLMIAFSFAAWLQWLD